MSSSPASAALDQDHARACANRRNAQLSTGPRTAEGKAVSCLNAVKTALTGRTVLLPTDDAAAYEGHIAAYQAEFEPVGVRESQLVQTIADTDWRLSRIPALESAVYARGTIEFARAFDIHPADLRPSLIQVETFLKYEKQLRNLQLQESRLRRQLEKAQAELRLLQRDRIRAQRAQMRAPGREKEPAALSSARSTSRPSLPSSPQQEETQLAEAAELYSAAGHDRQSFHPADHGFEFSIEDIEAYIQRAPAAQLFRASRKTVA